ncbi:MAG: glycosyltransferase [Patescibacteria group bacterium]
MKKILFITSNWLTDYGGRRITTTKIINSLPSRNTDVTVADFEVTHKVSNRPYSKKDFGFSTRVNFQQYFLKSNGGTYRYLATISDKRKYDAVVIVGSTYFNLTAILAVIARRLFRGSEKILFCHTHPLKSIQFISMPPKNFIYHLGYYLLSYFSYRFFDRIVTPSYGLRQFFVNRLGTKKERVFVINNPVFNGRDRNPAIRRNYDTSTEKVIVTAARLDLFQKDFKTLFKALKEVNEKMNCRLVILGKGSDGEKIVALARKSGIADKVSFPGFVKNPMVFMRKADIFVLSSFFEGSPTVLVEAMMAGIPVVSSNCDFGPREILDNGKNGLLVPVGDYKAMASAVLRLLQDKKLKEKLIINGLKRAEFYSEDKSYSLWGRLLK